jgi:hypothetical protein
MGHHRPDSDDFWGVAPFLVLRTIISPDEYQEVAKDLAGRLEIQPISATNRLEGRIPEPPRDELSAAFQWFIEHFPFASEDDAERMRRLHEENQGKVLQKPQDLAFLPRHYGVALYHLATRLPIFNPELAPAQNLFPPELLDKHTVYPLFINEVTHRDQGLVLVTGPTGSGKTTTLYAFINAINTDNINIQTIEDPIEYEIEGINQTQTDPFHGITFAAGLRSLLRCDPDVILVGESRDPETAHASVHAALTGHLVCTTLHANDSLRAISRLLSMGIENYLLADALALMEMCPITPELQSLVAVGAPMIEMRQAALRDGFMSLYQEGLMHVLAGNTTFEEIACLSYTAPVMIDRPKSAAAH